MTHFLTCSNTLCVLTCTGYDRASSKQWKWDLPGVCVLETPPSSPSWRPNLSATLFAEFFLVKIYTYGGKSRTECTVMCLLFQDYKPASIVLMQESTRPFLVKHDKKRSRDLSLFVPQIAYTLQIAKCASCYLF